MGTVLLIGGLFGAAIGVVVFNYLKSMGQVDLLVRLCYVVFLGIIGSLMFVESLRAIQRSRSNVKVSFKRKQRNWVHTLPFKMRFRTSGLYISAIPPLIIGVAVGVLAAIMGVGGGFVMVPAMMDFFILLIIQRLYQQMTPMAVLLLVGGVIGAQIGAQVGARLKAEQLRILLALLVLMVCGNLGLALLMEPAELYSIASGAGH